MNNIYTIKQLQNLLLPIFAREPIYKAVLFGSYANGLATEKSDIDIVIDSQGKIRGIDFFGILEDVTSVLNKPVDLIEMSQVIEGGRVQKEILEKGIVIYEKALA